MELHAPLGKSDHSLIKLMHRTQPEELPEKIVCNYVKAGFQKTRQHLDIEWETFFGDCKVGIDSAWVKFINNMSRRSVSAFLGRQSKLAKRNLAILQTENHWRNERKNIDSGKDTLKRKT